MGRIIKESPANRDEPEPVRERLPSEPPRDPTAKEQLLEALLPGEAVEAIVFGNWGWSGYNEPKPPPIPADFRGRILSLEEASPLLDLFSFSCGFGSPRTYETFIWTNRRVGLIETYDGRSELVWVPRNPTTAKPYMIGGG